MSAHTILASTGSPDQDTVAGRLTELMDAG
ncbi:hypothetical protein CLV63_12414 [Murinocardiopsis flavida]|uniref:Uncharacterized protein n=1 Tax=Murinocardiopsis flavida TaxID=645275 RepID=A0A2P8CY56_9ACTN|nr:hypothetical protein CLV63_12414 [Murinocardiopsis flavida]